MDENIENKIEDEALENDAETTDGVVSLDDRRMVEIANNAWQAYQSTQAEKADLKKKKKAKKTAKKIIKEVVSYLVILVAAFMIALLLNIYVIRKSDVIGSSMLPSYVNGQSVMISRMPYIFGEPKRGDVIVFDSTKEHRTFAVDVASTLKDNAFTRVFFDEAELYSSSHRYYIKRVIGVAGDTITVKDGVMYLNGDTLKTNGYQIYDPSYTYHAYEGRTWAVGEGELFVMGDNRGNSEDSRVIGTIPVECILGKVVKD